MSPDPKGPQAAGWRQRKFDLLRRFPIPLDLLPGSLTVTRTRCGNPSCPCAEGQGHEAWTLTFMSHGKRRVERIPKDWVQDERAQAGVRPLEFISGRDVRRPFCDIPLQIEHNARGKCHVSRGDCRGKVSLTLTYDIRSEERRVGKECR